MVVLKRNQKYNHQNMSETETFRKISGFCAECGSILPPLGETGNVKCYACKREFSPDSVYGESKVKYTIHFNSREVYEKNSQDEQKRKDKEDQEDGPVVDRKCPKCGNEKMSYATLQLRSADEGQTVFYTCTKCKYKESENS